MQQVQPEPRAPAASFVPSEARMSLQDLMRREAHIERSFRGLTLSCAFAVLVLLGGIIVTLIHGSWPALRAFRLGFLTREVWNPVTDEYGALAPLYGTVMTSAIAMIVAIPVAFGIAIFLTETCPRWLREPIAAGIELLAAIPSIVYGIWGLLVLGPLLQSHLQPWLIEAAAPIPWVNKLFQGPPFGIGILTAGLVLAIMVLPFITSVMREVFRMTPIALKEAAYGLGATQWEVVWDVVVPAARRGIVGGIMLGLGRALGETMAVTFVIGNAQRISTSLLAPGTTISAAIANEFTESVSDLYTSALIALGLLLFCITFIVIAAARLLLLRLEHRAGQMS